MNRIRELREARGLSQKALAALVNVTPSALNKVEMGTRGLDQLWMRRLAQHLGCAPAEILPREDNPGVMTEDERALLDAYRRASNKERDTFGKVAEAILPFNHPRDQVA